MPRVLLPLLGALLALALAAPVAAQAAQPRLRLVPTSLSAPDGLLDDGEALVGVVHRQTEAVTATVTLVDTSGATPSRTLSAPQHDCVPVQLRPGELLWSCYRSGTGDYAASRAQAGFVEDVATRSLHPLPDVAGLLSIGDDAATWTALGARWAELTISGYHYAYPRYYDRLTGAWADEPQFGWSQDVDVDLDAPTLGTPLCSTVSRPLQPDGQMGQEPAPIQHRDGWWGAGGDVDGSWLLRLMRCGRPPLTLSEASYTDGFAYQVPALGDGLVAWTEDRENRTRLAVRLLDGRRVGPVRRIEVLGRARPVALGRRLYALRSIDDRLVRVALGPRQAAKR